MSVTAAKYSEESVRDAFVTGLQSNQIRQRLLENKTLDLKTMFNQARPLDSVMRSSESYMVLQPSFNAAVPPPPPANPVQLDSTTLAAAQADGQTCFFCSNNKHATSAFSSKVTGYCSIVNVT